MFKVNKHKLDKKRCKLIDQLKIVIKRLEQKHDFEKITETTLHINPFEKDNMHEIRISLIEINKLITND